MQDESSGKWREPGSGQLSSKMTVWIAATRPNKRLSPEVVSDEAVQHLRWFSLALDGSCDGRDSAQWLIFWRGVTAKPSQDGGAGSHVRSQWRGATARSDSFTAVNTSLDQLGLKWDELAA